VWVVGRHNEVMDACIAIALRSWIVDILLRKWFPLQGRNFAIGSKSNEDVSLLPPPIPLVIHYHSYKEALSTSKRMSTFSINLINTRRIKGIQAFIMYSNKTKKSWKKE